MNLQHIDLSENRLKQIHFKMRFLTQLNILDLSYNRIEYLDEESFKSLHELDRAIGKQHNWTVDLRNNPLDCSSCEHLDYMSWVLESGSLFQGNIQCLNKSGQTVNVTNELKNCWA